MSDRQTVVRRNLLRITRPYGKFYCVNSKVINAIVSDIADISCWFLVALSFSLDMSTTGDLVDTTGDLVDIFQFL